MTFNMAFNIYAVPVFMTSLLFIGLFILSFNRKNRFGEKYFSYLMASCFLYSFFYGLNLSAEGLVMKRWFHYFEFTGGVFAAPGLLLFVLKYSDRSSYINWKWMGLVLGFSSFFLFMVLTNDLHMLFYKSIGIHYNGYFEALVFERNTIHWIYVIYNSILIILSNLLLIRMFFSIPDLYRNQVFLMIFGTLVPWLAYLIVAFGNYPFGMDPVPFCLAISSLIIFWGLFRYQLFRANPIAFKTIFENIFDGILILDRNGEIVAINLSARKIISQLGGKRIFKKQQLMKISKEFEELFFEESVGKKVEIYVPTEKKTYLAHLKDIEKDSSTETPEFQYLFLRDISEQKATEEIIKANEIILQNVNSNLIRNEKMLTSIAFATKELLSNQDFAIATQKAVTLLGDGAGVDRAYLFQNRVDENGNILCSQRFEWSALGVPPEIDNPNLQDLPVGLFGEGTEAMLQNKSYQAIVSKIDNDPELVELLSSQDIKSILLIPIYVKDYFWGYVGFDDCTFERVWSDAETALLISFADSISNAIERKNLEQNLIYSMEKAKEASVAKSEFLTNMSHEIRTPLNGVIGFADLLMKTNLEDKQIEFLKSISQSGNLLLELITDILDFSKIEAGKLELTPDWINIRELAEDTLSIIKPIAEEKDLKLEIDISKTLPKYVFTDMIRLKQVLINLLSNASKFTHKGSIKISIQGDTPENPKKPAKIFFSVTDTGIGISKEKEETIFEAFAQEDNSTTRKYGGTGLGLTISSKLLELMNSQLNLDSKLGEGSVFSFTLSLPFSQEDKSGSQNTRKQGNESEEQLIPSFDPNYAYKILLVDDNPVNMLLAKSIVKKIISKAEIIEACNGLEAIQQYQRTEPDMIFMDIQMPELSGYEATQQIRVLEEGVKHTPIVALTAGTVKGEYERCIDAGMDNYLSKPVLVSDIAGMVEKYLGASGTQVKKEEKLAESRLDEYKETDPEFYFELVETSFSSVSQLITKIEKELVEEDWLGILQTSHAIKGVGLNLGLDNLVKITSMISGSEKLDLNTKKQSESLISELRELLEYLNKERLAKS